MPEVTSYKGLNRKASLLLLAALAAFAAALAAGGPTKAQGLAAGPAAPTIVPPEPVPARRDAAGDASHLVITLAGDVGLNPNRQAVDPRGVFDGPFQAWSDTTAAIAHEIDGDINFMNVETVVTDRNDLAPDLKNQKGPFNFRTHPNGLAHLVGAGFNLLSLANNHSMDYGPAGVLETLRHTEALKGSGLLAAAGVGRNFDEAASTHVFNVKGARIAFAATGIITNDLPRHRAGPASPGQTSYRSAADYAEVRRRLVAEAADLRILSIHYGTEGQVRTDQRQIRDFRGLAAATDKIDLIVGHHAHVVRGVEMHGGSLIFYGLGNFLHHGTANMNGKGICRDYGLFARVHLLKEPDGRLAIKAVEAIPVADTHFRPRALKGESGRARVHALNYLAGTLDANGARGLRFAPQENGTGLFCVDGAAALAGPIGTLCKAYKPAGGIPESLRGSIQASCSR